MFDFDHETYFCDSPHKQTTRKIMRSFCDGFKNGWIGRKLPHVLRAIGMADVSVKPHTAMVHYEFAELLLGGHVAGMHAARALSDEEASSWWTSLAQVSRDGVFTFGVTAFIVSGMKR